MRKMLTAALAALTVGGAALAATSPADARGWGPGAAVGAGLLGVAVGASLASPHYYYGPPPGYYEGPYYYGYYGGCRHHWRWDRYYHRYIMVGRCY